MGVPVIFPLSRLVNQPPHPASCVSNSVFQGLDFMRTLILIRFPVLPTSKTQRQAQVSSSDRRRSTGHMSFKAGYITSERSH